MRVALSAHRLADEVLEVIEERFAGDLSLAGVARELARSPSGVARAVKASTGHTVVELIAARRLQEAKRLLSESDLSVAEIADRAGFGCLGYFHRAFRRATDTTPLRWRALVRA